MRSPSPRDRLQDELTSEIAAGTIASTDLDALTAALDSIDQTLTSQRTSDRATGTAPPSPDQMKAKIDDLIAGRSVERQADERAGRRAQERFRKCFLVRPRRSGGTGRPRWSWRRPGGPRGAQGADDGSESDGTESSSLDANLQELLASFLKMLQQTMSETKGYDSNSQTKSVTAALIVDFQS